MLILLGLIIITSWVPVANLFVHVQSYLINYDTNKNKRKGEGGGVSPTHKALEGGELAGRTIGARDRCRIAPVKTSEVVDELSSY